MRLGMGMGEGIVQTIPLTCAAKSGEGIVMQSPQSRAWEHVIHVHVHVRFKSKSRL